MKNISIIITILMSFSITFSTFANEEKNTEQKKFIVTAYYSPLPNQSFYLKGSYEADIRLNGNGTHGASGKEVYPGMIAAPKTYAFGTQVYLEGLGIGTVDDRGGAIVSSGSRGYNADRIDIWMGQGEEGLRRALSWGKRSISGKIISEEELVPKKTIDFSQVKLVSIHPTTYRKQPVQNEEKTTDKMNIFNMYIDKNTNSEKIREFQTILSQLSYYDGDINGKYSKSVENAIYDFQIENQLVVSKKTPGAGNYGVKTRAKLQEIYTLYTENEKVRIEEENRIALMKVEQEKRMIAQKTEIALFVQSFGDPKPNEAGIHIRNLQQSLKALGHFSGKDTAIFGKNTRAALISYQTQENIPVDELGILGKMTKESLYRDILAIKNKKLTDLAFNN